MKIREIALNNLSIDHLREGETYSTLEDRLVPYIYYIDIR